MICLTLLNGANIDLAFIDVHMPELSGREAFWSARTLGIKTFVTLMSSPPAAEAVEMAIKLQAYEFLFKPFSLNDVLAVIKTYARISSPTRVLIVDDSLTVRQLVQKIVHGSVFKTEIADAADGDAALTRARTSEFDAVFLDCNMPGMSGLATMTRLMLLQPSVNIVMISAERDAAKGQEALESGACGGHIFEYPWSARPPYLHNGVVHAAKPCDIAPAHVEPVAEKTALLQLRSARLVAAA